MRPNTLDDVWERVDVRGPADCWPWTGLRSDRGYGKVRIRNRHLRAHRVIAEATIGPVAGQVVMHTCDNPPCCNPAHLRIGTTADNVRDKWAKGRGGVNRTRGEDRPGAKLRESDVRDIRALLGAVPQTEIARRFGVGKSTVGAIATGDSWGWLA